MAPEDTGVMPLTIEDRRQAEINAGRERVREALAGMDPEARKAAVKRGEEELRESEEQRKRVLQGNVEAVSKAERDRSGAEVQDQAQTALEAVQHLANRNEPIIDMRRETIIERLEEDADPEAADELVLDHVTAQAVNQPTILASERGQETEDRPLNTTQLPGGVQFPDEALALDQQQMPTERETPKTRAKAEKVAKGKVPKAKDMVKEGATTNDPDPKTVDKGAVKAVRAVSNDILGDAEDDPENE